MKKFLKILFITLCAPNLAICQTIIGQKNYVYYNFRDTIHFSSIKTNFTEIGGNPIVEVCDVPKIIDSLQIDGIGRKEIVFYLFSKFSNSQHGGTFSIVEATEIGKYEIWNLDTKAILFEAINYKKNDFDSWRGGLFPYSKGSEFYNYHFSIDSLGIITIKYAVVKLNLEKSKENKKTRKKSFSNVKYFSLKPDKEEGVYKFINGAYLKEENE